MSVMEALASHAELCFGVFPPRTGPALEALCSQGLEALYAMEPTAISCICQAPGDVGRSLELLSAVAAEECTVPVARLPEDGSESLRAQLEAYLSQGIDHVIAQQIGTAAFIRREFGSLFTIDLACTAGVPLPEELWYADYLAARPCWDADAFRRWLDSTKGALPVEAEIVPVLDQAQTLGMALPAGGLPETLSSLIARCWIYPNPFVRDPFDAEVERKRAEFRKAGVEFTLGQIEAFRACGADGICLHVPGQPEDLVPIVKAAGY